MNYGRMQTRVTMIDELPDLEDLEVDLRPVPMDRHIMERPNPQDDRYQKHIRSTHKMNIHSGMDNIQSHQSDNHHIAIQPFQEMATPQPLKMMTLNHMDINCVDISKHIQDCPICSKFYHNDKTVYIIAIVVLSIVCLLLLKRVLNV